MIATQASACACTQTHRSCRWINKALISVTTKSFQSNLLLPQPTCTDRQFLAFAPPTLCHIALIRHWAQPWELFITGKLIVQYFIHRNSQPTLRKKIIFHFLFKWPSWIQEFCFKPTTASTTQNYKHKPDISSLIEHRGDTKHRDTKMFRCASWKRVTRIVETSISLIIHGTMHCEHQEFLGFEQGGICTRSWFRQARFTNLAS